MGMEPGTKLQILDITELQPPPADLGPVIEAAYGHRPELQRLQAEIAAGEAAVRIAQTGLKPQVSARAEAGCRDDSFFLGDSAWSVGVSGSMPLSDGGETKSRVAEERSRLTALRARQEDLRQRVALEVTTAALGMREAFESTSLAREQVRLARHNSEIAELRYKVGEARPVEVTDARAALTEALTNEVGAVSRCQTARAALARAMGLLPTEAIEPQ
jgi:outer membrane protein TolC